MYLNFESPILDDLSYKEIRKVVEIQRELFPKIMRKKIYLFIDEPQVIEKWELAIRNLQDDYNIEIFLTGSSSKLLSQEIATSLRGRSLTFKLLTLSFREYLDFKGVSYQQISSNKKVTILKEFDRYLLFGAYPEIVLEKDEDIKIRILQDYLDLTIYKDLVERYKIKNTDLVKMLIDMIVSANSNEFSLNKYYSDLKSRGVKVGKDTVYEYFDHLVDAFFVHPLKKFSFSRRTENLSTVKVYLGDIGFMNLYSLKNYGIRLENIVFLELLRRTHQNPLQKLNYWKSGDDYEVDFVVSEGRKVRKLVQVSLNMQNEMTREREVRGLLAGMRRFELGEGLILTREEEQILKIDGKKIQVLPIWKWLLDLEVV
jgi:predicted AAA+ superfamily ATPase